MSPYRKYSHRDPRRYIKWADGRLGFRGSILLVLGIASLIMGVSVFMDISSTANLYPLLGDWFPIRLFRSILWWSAGILAIIASFRKAGHDALGWMAIYIPFGYRLLGYLHGYSIWLTEAVLRFLHDEIPLMSWVYYPDGMGGSPGGLISVAVWASLIFIVVRCSAWPEPSAEEVRDSEEVSL